MTAPHIRRREQGGTDRAIRPLERGVMLDHAYFIERTVCPCCANSDCHTIYECAFDADPIRQYLRDHYEPQGGVEFEFLQGARFVLQQCRTCSVIFQAQIGNDVLMHKLYEEWIDPARPSE